jgi:hypothetical protein
MNVIERIQLITNTAHPFEKMSTIQITNFIIRGLKRFDNIKNAEIIGMVTMSHNERMSVADRYINSFCDNGDLI